MNAKNEKTTSKSRVKSFFTSLHRARFETIVALINLVCIGSGNVYAIMIFAIYYEIFDIIIATSFFVFILTLLSVSLYLTIMKKSALLSIVLHAMILLLYLAISLFNVFFIPLLIINLLSIMAYTSNYKIKPTFKSKASVLVILPLILLVIMLPILCSFVFEVLPLQIEIPARTQNIEVNFCIEFEHKDKLGILDLPIYTNSSPLSNEVVANLSYWNNNLTNVNISITLAIHEAQLSEDNSSAINCTRRLNSSGISVDAWLLLSEDKGYWPYDGNAEQFFELYNTTFRNWRNTYGLFFRRIFVDAESLHLSSLAKGLQDISRMLSTFWTPQHEAALAVYDRLITQVHDDSMEIGITSYQYIIPDDLLDGDQTLQRIMELSFFPPTSFDYYSVMSYSQGPGSDYSVYLSGKMTQRYFGPQTGKAAIIFNVIEEPLSSITNKIHILRNLGIDKIVIYSLEGFLDTSNGLTDLDLLFQEIQTPKPISVDYSSSSSFYGVQIHLIVRYLLYCLDWWIKIFPYDYGIP